MSAIAAIAACLGAVMIAPSAPPAGAAPPEEPPIPLNLPDGSVNIPFSVAIQSHETTVFEVVRCIDVAVIVYDGETYGLPVPFSTGNQILVQRATPDGWLDLDSVFVRSDSPQLSGYPDFSYSYAPLSAFQGHSWRDTQQPHQPPFPEDKSCSLEERAPHVDEIRALAERFVLWTLGPVDLPGPVPPIVNSTGDAAALDPATMGCDTGGTVGSEPECTLRAAIETVNATDNDEITFDIAGAGVPTITVGSALPAVTSGAMMDGTTQAAGFVRVVGGTYDGTALTVGGEPSSVSGLNIDQFAEGIVIESGDGHVVDGNRFGTNAAGTAVGDLKNAIASIGDAGVDITGNTMVCGGFCLDLQGTSGSTVVGNDIGVGPGGQLLETGNGMVLFGAEIEVRDNVVATTGTGIALIGQETAGSTITDNRIGVTRAGADVSGGERGIRVEGAPGVTVSGNVVATRGTTGPDVGGIEVTGSVQAYQVEGVDDEGNAAFRIVFPSADDVGGGAVTGGDLTITDNTVGLLADGVTPAAKQPVNGVVVWAGASNVIVDGNVIAPRDGKAVTLLGGSGHRVVNNQLGIEADAGSERGTTIGIAATAVSDLAVGAAGVGNVITAAGGVVLSESTDVVVVDNVVDAVSIGIAADQDTIGLTVRGNTLFGARSGVVSTAESTVVESNRVGVNPAGGVVAGQRFGIVVESDNAVINDNTVVGSSENAISALLANPQLRGNEIYDTSKLPIETLHQAPQIAAVIDASTTTTNRTLLVVTGMAPDLAGTIEVFANDSCDDVDGETRYVLDVIATKKVNRTWAVVPLIGRGDRDSFTVTYTNDVEGTTRLSNCVDRAPGVDADGDGSPDAIEELFSTDSDPQAAVVVTNDGDLLLLETTAGSLVGVGIVDDPAPGAHPGGFTLPHGVVGFEVDGVVPGGAATVVLRSLDDDSPIQGDGYWKHGPRPGTTSTGWYRFDYDEDSNTGARLVVGDSGDEFTRVWQINLVDGGRGDNDRLENGTISDPGGPAFEADTSASTTTTTQPASGAVTTTTQPASGAVTTTTVVAVPATLPATGTGTRRSMTLGILFLAVGLGALTVSNRRRSGSESQPAPHR